MHRRLAAFHVPVPASTIQLALSGQTGQPAACGFCAPGHGKAARESLAPASHARVRRVRGAQNAVRNALRTSVALLLAIGLASSFLFARAEPEQPARDDEGFLEETGEYVYENDEEGRWAYFTDRLQIEITRYTDESVPLEWFETHIKLRDGEALTTVETNPDRPGKKFRYPFDIAADNHFVLGFTDDFYGHRLAQKEKVGVVIRNGAIVSRDTYRKQLHYLPNLDVLAQFPDRSLKAYRCADITADELLELGAVNVFCFGPALILDGEINPLVLEKWFETKSPRQALGMIEPGHYLLLTVQGRMKTSAGVGLIYMAEAMKERGVVEALNLDGGNTMALIFRGRMINRLATWKNKKFVRTVSSLIGVGYSEYEVE